MSFRGCGRSQCCGDHGGRGHRRVGCEVIAHKDHAPLPQDSVEVEPHAQSESAPHVRLVVLIQPMKQRLYIGDLCDARPMKTLTIAVYS